MNRRLARLKGESGEMPSAGPAPEQHTPGSSEPREQLLPQSSVSHGPLPGAAAMGTEPGLPQARLQPANLRRASLEMQAATLALSGLVIGAAELVRRVLSSGSQASYGVLWFGFALMAPATWVAKELSTGIMARREQACFVTVKLQSAGSRWDRCLMEALVHELRKQKAVSSISEAVTEYGDEDEEGEAKWQVSLLPWLRGTKLHISSASGEGWEATVDLQQKDPVICGRAQEPRRAELATLRVCSASSCEFLCCGLDVGGRIAARMCSRQQHVRSTLAAWLQVILEQFTCQKPGQVQVYELQEEYKDYRPSWELIREECCCSSAASGLSFYTEQPWAERVRRRVDFALGHGGKSRLTLFVAGPKGSGKTVFVEWLAGELRAPVYYIDLRSPGINDTVLRDATARNRLRHSPPVLFHLDEFQAPLQQWLAGKDSQVSIEGLQSLLEGISTPNSAVFIFTSSAELPALDTIEDPRLRQELQGLLRRLQCQETIPSLDLAAAKAYIRGFLRGYIDVDDWPVMCARADWKAFAAAWQHWDPGVAVPFDMLSKYAEQAVRDFYVDGGWLTGCSQSRGRLRASGRALTFQEQMPATPAQAARAREAFLQAVFNTKAVEAFAKEYAGGAHLTKFRGCGSSTGLVEAKRQKGDIEAQPAALATTRGHARPSERH